MKTLHFIPNHLTDIGITLDAEKTVMVLAERMEVHVVSFKKLPTTDGNPHIKVHLIGFKSSIVETLNVRDHYLQILYDVMPDVVHVHGCWNYLGAKVMKWSAQRGFITAMTPYDMLHAYRFSPDYLKTRWWSSWFFQRAMNKRADMIFAGSEKEAGDIGKLTKHPCIVTFPHLTKDQWLDEMEKRYTSIRNSRIRVNLSRREGKIISTLLHAATAGNQCRINDTGHRLIANITADQWRNILLYAKEEYIVTLLLKGKDQLNADLPPVNEHSLSSFKPLHPKSSSGLESKDGLLSMLSDARQRVRTGKLSLYNLSELYRFFLTLDTDEDTLTEQLKKKNLLKFTARMEQIMRETLALTEGFMPVEPIDDRKTEHMRKQIIS